MAYPRGSRWEGFIPNNGLLVRAKAALAEHGHTAFGEWRSLVGGQSALRNVDGLSVGMERRRLHGLGNAVVPEIPYRLGNAVLAALNAQRAAA
jgi:hypothetical protein